MTAVDRDGLAPAPVPGAAGAPVGDGFVVHAPSLRAAASLNGTAALVWQLLDGTTTIGELAGDLSVAFDAPLDVVRDDLVAAVDHLAALGLLAVAGRPVPDPPGFEPDGDGVVRPVDAPCRCLGGFARIAWAGAVTVAVGRTSFAVRCNDAAALGLLADALAAHVGDDPLAGPWLSVELSAPPQVDDGAPFLTLYRERRPVARCRSTTALWAALEAQLAAPLAAPAAAAHGEAPVLALDVGALAVGGGVELLRPRSLAPLDDGGLAGPLLVDVGRRALVPTPELELDRAAVARFCDLLPGPVPPRPDGQRVVGVAGIAAGAGAVAEMLPAVLGPRWPGAAGRDGGDAVALIDAMARLVGGVAA